MKRIRIFISSPGDVHEEREIARGVIQQLGRTFAGRLQLQPVLWEELALGADQSFQKGIDQKLSKLDLDIAVFILWARLGSPTEPLGDGDQVKPFRSGTEREWYLMLQAREECVKRGVSPQPEILVYTRQNEVSFGERLRGKSDELKVADYQQKLLLKQFIKEQFHDTDSGVNVRAFHDFDQPTAFAKLLRTHLTELLESMYGFELEHPYWNITEQGPPFRGLDAFDFEHAPIFFGREDELVAIRNRLREQACRGCAFMLISGASGSGKSSLARAGVLHDIVTHEIDSDIHKWRWCVIKPNQLGEDLLSGFVNSLLAKDVLPELAAWSDDLAVPSDANRLNGWSTCFLLRVKDALNACGTKRGSTRLLLLIDQLEELFSGGSQTSESIQQFFEVLELLARSGMVWVVATVRSDFYHECQKISALVRMKDGAGQFDLVTPASDSLLRVITGPAQLASLKFEKVDSDHTLADLIIRESIGCAELLPLLEYLLLDLFQNRTTENVLTLARYEELGGLEGALRLRCEDTYTSLPDHVQAALPTVLSKLVTLSGDDLNTAVRRELPWERIQENPTELELVSAMVAQRLFSTYSDSNGAKVVSVTHEAVLRIWPRVSKWTEENRAILRIRARVEQSQARWKQQQEDNSLLLADGVPLNEGRQLYTAMLHLLDSETEEYIIRSIVYQTDMKRQRRNFVVGLASVALLLVAFVAWYGWQVRNRTLAEGIVNAIVAADPIELERLIKRELPNHRAIADKLLHDLSQANNDPKSKPGLHARLALQPIDSASLESLQEAMLSIPEPDYLAIIVRTLKNQSSQPNLWPNFRSQSLDPEQRFHTGLALATLSPNSSEWSDDDLAFLVDRLVQSNPVHQPIYFELLKPIAERLIEPLRNAFSSETSGQVQQVASANALATFARKKPEVLIEFLISATPEQYNILFPVFDGSEPSKATLLTIVQTEPDTNMPQVQRVALGIRRAGAAITLLKTGARQEIFPLFRVADDPESLSQFVARCKDRGVSAAQLLECIAACEATRQVATGNERVLQDCTLHGLLLALGDLNLAAVPDTQREPLKTQLLRWYESDPSSTIHGATEWLLRRWGYHKEVQKIRETPVPYDPSGKRDWFTIEVKITEPTTLPSINKSVTKPRSLFFTMIVFSGGSYELGSPLDEAKRGSSEVVRKAAISIPFAISDRELTWNQYDCLDQGQWHQSVDKKYGRQSDGNEPMHSLNWFECVSYCRWLTSHRGLGDDLQCYDAPVELEKDELGNPLYRDFYHDRSGFRLPTEAEWEIACRSGSRATYNFGSDLALLRHYCWYTGNSNEVAHITGLLRPNLKGLYDIHGNMLEWCHDWHSEKIESGVTDPVGAEAGAERVRRGGSWYSSATHCRSSNRDSRNPATKINNAGLRLAVSLAPPTSAPPKREGKSETDK